MAGRTRAKRPRTTASTKSTRAAPRSRTREADSAGSDLLMAGTVAVGVFSAGLAYVKHQQAKVSAFEALQARQDADDARRAAEEARLLALTAETRARKLAAETAYDLHAKLARLNSELAPLLRFDGCSTAATNRVDIRIDMQWIFKGIVDPAREIGSILGRVAGALAHEWFHFLDTAPPGTRTPHEEELAADAFAGKMLAQLRIPPKHFADLLRQFPHSRMHPDGGIRAARVLDAHTSEARRLGA
jgi:hypothetical protein